MFSKPLRLDDVDFQALQEGRIDRLGGLRVLEIGDQRLDFGPVTFGNWASGLLPQPHADEGDENGRPSGQLLDRHLPGDRFAEFE